MPPNGDPLDPTLIVFAALAVFVIWRLRSVLGVKVEREDAPRALQRTAPVGRVPLPGAEPPGPATPSRPATERWEGVAAKGVAPAWSGLDAIAAADSRFDGKAFLAGARRAYEIVVEAFARGDRDRLRDLLSNDVFGGFAAEIDRREAAGETLDSGVVAIDSAVVEDARAAPGRNEITVRFEARIMSVRKDRAGAQIDGGSARRVVESWTFARDPHASDPNWKLVATKAEA